MPNTQRALATAITALVRNQPGQVCPPPLDPRHPMQRENALKLPTPWGPWRTLKTSLLRTSALTYGTVGTPTPSSRPRHRQTAVPPASPPTPQPPPPTPSRQDSMQQRALVPRPEDGNPPQPPDHPARIPPSTSRGQDPMQQPALYARPEGKNPPTPPIRSAQPTLAPTQRNPTQREEPPAARGNHLSEAPQRNPMQREDRPNPAAKPAPWHRLANTYLRATVLLYETLRTPVAKSRPTGSPGPTSSTPRPQAREHAPPRQNPMHLFGPVPPPGFATPATGLRNNNPRGNPNAAPRCGARTRTGNPCRSPAMPNGRCRMHGGRSTGPRTIEGLNRLRAANTTHGAYSAARSATRPSPTRSTRRSTTPACWSPPPAPAPVSPPFPNLGATWSRNPMQRENPGTESAPLIATARGPESHATPHKRH
jgi:hypothetical protein